MPSLIVLRRLIFGADDEYVPLYDEGDALLLETGDYLLLETGDKLLLEG